MKQYVSRIVVLLLVSALLSSLGYAALAQTEETENPVITATEDGVTLPEQLVAGIVTLTYQNDTEAPFAPVIARLHDGKTFEDFLAAMQEGPAAALSVLTLLGSPEAAPGGSVDVTYDLLAGDYILVSFASEGPPTMLPFSVEESEDEHAEEPEADEVVLLTDFAFAMPTVLQAGVQLWQIVNIGEQPHEMAVYRVEDGATLADVTSQLMEVLMSAQDGPPEIPFETAFFWSPMSPEARAWIEMELEPGTYVAVCFIPDLASDEPVSHLEQGMILIVTVEE